jgi:LysR family glycine cleavage system transcriptional activator
MPIQAPRPRLPSLNALRAFEAAARLGHFGKAADEIGVTPSAVAQQVRQLEEWLGRPLFHRLAHGVRLTDPAREALPQLVEGFDALGQAVRQLRTIHGSKELSICALPSIAQIWLSPRLPRLRKAFPGLQVSLSVSDEPPDFRRDLFDLALFYVSHASEDVTAVFLADDALFPVCAPELLPDGPTRLSPGELAHQTLLHDAVWRTDWARWLKFAGVRGVDPLRGPVFSLYSLAIESAIAGGGFLMGRRTLLGGMLTAGLLVAPFGIEMPLPDRLAITMPKKAPPSPSRAEVVSWLQANA